jgi:hypothetical protein
MLPPLASAHISLTSGGPQMCPLVPSVSPVRDSRARSVAADVLQVEEVSELRCYRALEIRDDVSCHVGGYLNGSLACLDGNVGCRLASLPRDLPGPPTRPGRGPDRPQRDRRLLRRLTAVAALWRRLRITQSHGTTVCAADCGRYPAAGSQTPVWCAAEGASPWSELRSGHITAGVHELPSGETG